MSFECYGYTNLDEWSLDGLGYVNSSILNEGGLVKKKVPDKVEGQFIQIQVHYTSSRFLMLFPGLSDLEIVVLKL